jgi:hypothetical protein
MEKWNRLQTLAHDKDECLKENRRKWKQFKRQLEDLEQAAQLFTDMENLCKLKKKIFVIRICFNWLFFSTSNGLFKSRCTS